MIANRDRRAAFTLLELLLTMGIMGMLGVAAAAGYGALTRGMRERAACAAASGLLRLVQERAAVDRVPTKVFCYNVCVREANVDSDEPAVVYGVMTAIRRGGRITNCIGHVLYDEFGDLDRTWEVMETGDLAEEELGHRLYWYGSGHMKYSVVADGVQSDDSEAITIYGKDAARAGGVAYLKRVGFYNLGTAGDREPTWKVGSAYGMEIGEIKLPEGFIFGRRVPTQVGNQIDVEEIEFTPDGSSSQTIEIYSTKPNARGVPQVYKKAGEAKADASEAV